MKSYEYNSIFTPVSYTHLDVYKRQILYIPNSDKKVVTILRVMYAGRDIDNQLNFHTKQ